MNNNKEIDSKRIKLARVKYFDLEKNGVEYRYFDDDPYVFLVNVDGKYVNLFDPSEDMPVYERIPYPNHLPNGDFFGTMIDIVQGEVKEGLCYLIDKPEEYELIKLFWKEKIRISDLINYMFNSKLFFIDRKDLLLESSKTRFSRRLRTLLCEDYKNLDDFAYFVNSHNKGVQFNKDNHTNK